MSENGAYESEMDEVALFETALRAAVPVKPDPQIGADLVPRLARLAHESSLDAGAARLAAASTTPRLSHPRSRLALVARVGLAAAMLVLLLAGLAVAGVTMPHSVRSAFDSVGVTLPNQPNDNPANNQGNAMGQPSSGQSPASDKASDQGKQASAAKGANGKHLAKGKSKHSNQSNPGRRVRRHGNTGAVPGPAHPPQGHAYGPSHSSGNSSQSNAGGGGSGGKSSTAHTHTQGAVHGQGNSK